MSKSVESLFTKCDDIAKDLHLLWCLGRNALSSDESDNETVNTDLPGFQAFTARFCDIKKESKVYYLPWKPESPTYPAVIKEEMLRLVQTSTKLGN